MLRRVVPLTLLCKGNYPPFSRPLGLSQIPATYKIQCHELDEYGEN